MYLDELDNSVFLSKHEFCEICEICEKTGCIRQHRTANASAQRTACLLIFRRFAPKFLDIRKYACEISAHPAKNPTAQSAHCSCTAVPFLIKNSKIKFEKIEVGSCVRYKIPIEKVSKYLSRSGELSAKQRQAAKCYYASLLRTYSDAMSAKEVRAVTGYSKEIIRCWIHKGLLIAVPVRRRFCVAKEDLINFMTSGYYRSIVRKCRKHREQDVVLDRLLCEEDKK